LWAVHVGAPGSCHVYACVAEGQVVVPIVGAVVDGSPHLGGRGPHHATEMANIPVVHLSSLWVVVVSTVAVELGLTPFKSNP